MADVPKTSKSCDYHPCVFTGCRRNKAKYPDLHFFRFPCKRPKICEQWLVNCANNSLSSLPRNKLHSKKVCELHFTEDCFTSTMRTFLKKTAVPTLLYDGTPLQISQPSPTALLQADVPHGGVSSASKSRKTSSSKMLFRISTIDTSQRPTSSDFIKIPLYINLKSIKNSEPSPRESCAVNHTEQIPKSHSDEDRHQALSMRYPNAAVRLGYKKVKTLIYRYREMGGYVADRMNFFKHIDEARDTTEPENLRTKQCSAPKGERCWYGGAGRGGEQTAFRASVHVHSDSTVTVQFAVGLARLFRRCKLCCIVPVPAMELERMLSTRGKELLIENGYKFFLSATTAVGEYWRCCVKLCPARIRLDLKGKVIEQGMLHNHEKPKHIYRDMIRNRVTQKAKTNTMEPKKLLDQELSNMPEQILNKLTSKDICVIKQAIEYSKRRVRKTHFPVLPIVTLHEHEEISNNDDPGLPTSEFSYDLPTQMGKARLTLSAHRKKRKLNPALVQYNEKRSADNDGAAQGNPSSMPGPSTSGQESEKGLEAEVPEGSGASSIESVPCASTSNIQFVASEITSMQDPEFGTLEKSGMSQTVLTPPPPPLKEGTSTQSQDVACGEEKEKQASLEESINIPSVDTTQKIPTSTVVNAEVAESIYPCRPKTSNILEESESDRLLRSMISAKKLDTVVERLEAVSNKLTLNTLSDQYDHFGKYIGSVLRGLPLKKVNSLKKKILSDIEAVMEEKESYLKSIGTQVGLDVLASEKSFKKYLKEKSQAKTVPADSKSLASNTPILGGNMPLLFPGASTSSFKLLPVIPMSATTSMVSSATLVTTPSLVSSVTSVHNVPVSTCETVTTVAKSADGTLLAVTIPKPKMCEAIVGPGQSLLIPPRGQKRKQTTAAYIIKKVPAPTSCETATLPTRITTSCVTATLPTRMTTSCETTTLPTRIITPCETTTLPTRMTTSCETTTLPTRMTTPGDAFSLNKQTISYSESGTQTGGDLQLQEDSRDSGGGDMSFIVPQPLKNEEQEFEMDFEEGNELAQIKQDQDFFETVLCGESSSMYIKEETPDLEEPSEGDLGAPPLPPVTISTPLICPICNTQCNNGDELARHHFSTHPEKKHLKRQMTRASGNATQDMILLESERQVKNIKTCAPVSSVCISPVQNLGSCSSDGINKSFEFSLQNKRRQLLKVFSLDSHQIAKAVASYLKSSESSTQNFSSPSRLNVSNSFGYIDYNTTTDTFRTPFVKDSPSKSDSLSTNELVPIAKAIMESNEICDGDYFMQGKEIYCDSKEENTAKDSLKKDFSDSASSEEFEACYDPDYEPCGDDASDDDSVEDDLMEDDQKLKEMQNIHLIPNEESNETNIFGNASVSNTNATVKRKRNKGFCFYCEDWITGFSRHVTRNHKSENDVQEILNKVPGSLERKKLISIIRKKGNYLASSTGVTRAVKKSSLSSTKLLPCDFCLGFYGRKQLWKHRRNCFLNPDTRDELATRPRCQQDRLSVEAFQTAKLAKLLLTMEKNKESNCKRKNKGDIDVEGELNSEENDDEGMDDRTAIMEHSISSEPSTSSVGESVFMSENVGVNKMKNLTKKMATGSSSLTGNTVKSEYVGIKLTKRRVTKWSLEEKAAVVDFFQNHIKESKPPRKKECEELMMKKDNLFQNKTWVKMKVLVQNLYTKKTKV